MVIEHFIDSTAVVALTVLFTLCLVAGKVRTDGERRSFVAEAVYAVGMSVVTIVGYRRNAPLMMWSPGCIVVFACLYGLYCRFTD